jgi:hypothetical protein
MYRPKLKYESPYEPCIQQRWLKNFYNALPIGDKTYHSLTNTLVRMPTDDERYYQGLEKWVSKQSADNIETLFYLNKHGKAPLLIEHRDIHVP